MGDSESQVGFARKLSDRAKKRETALAADGQQSSNGMIVAEFSKLRLKPDHIRRPCWTCPDGIIFLEAFHDVYESAYEFLVATAEPVARPEFVHQYKLTPYSLYAAVATNIETAEIISVLDRLSKNELPDKVKKFIRACTQKYGKAKLVLKHNKFYVESEDKMVLRELLRDETIAKARVQEDVENLDSHRFFTQRKAEEMKENLAILREPGDDSDDDEDAQMNTKVVFSFQVRGDDVGKVKRQAMELDYPLMEEYDFKNDQINPNVPQMDLKPHTRIRRYQERSLAKIFGNGRARSGIIVLPCGAGKTLTGVIAAQTVGKSVVCLCTSALSVLQWKYQFQLWTSVADENVCVFTSEKENKLPDGPCVLVTTYAMIINNRRSAASQAIMDSIISREWGMLLMDEVHVVAAPRFRHVIGSVKAHCRLGLTATLVREDDSIGDLNFLIGPKLYEANWMDLTAQGYLANVQCVEVWCPMTGPFMQKYLTASDSQLKQLLYVTNPAKFRAVEFLVRFHEKRGDKILLFSDRVYSLKLYAEVLKRPMICGTTPEKERQAILGLFRTVDEVSTICLSKIGDTSIDLPEANVIIQVSSQFGSRRQEAQRLGRILRPKSYTQQDGSNRSSFNAFFYTLVSTDTQEMFYSTKRQQYLIDQGYTFKIVTNLCEIADSLAKKDGYAYATPKDDAGLLQHVLDSAGDLEKDQHAEDKAIRNNADGAVLADESVHRATGESMTQLSGGSRHRYKETKRGGPVTHHPLSEKRQRR